MYTNILVTEQVAQAYLAEEKRQAEVWRRNQTIRKDGDAFGGVQIMGLSLRRLHRRKNRRSESRPTLATPAH